MKGLAWLSWRHLAQHRWQSGVLILCIALAVFLPWATRVIVNAYQEEMRARAVASPFLVGMKGNRFDLTFNALYFRPSQLRTLTFPHWEELQATEDGIAIPLHVRNSAQGHPVVGTSPEYFEYRRLVPASGRLPLQLGEVALGAAVARKLRLEPGDSLFSDQHDLYDISKPPALKMHVCGVLARTATPDDHAVFIAIQSAWILEGLTHGHADPETELPENFILKESERNVAVSQALIEYNEVTPENLESFHYHGDPALLPLSAVLFVPASIKAGTLAKARVNSSKDLQMIVPLIVVDDLMEIVFQIKRFLDRFALILLIVTTVFTGLVFYLGLRLRAAEFLTLHRMGCSPFVVAKLFALEILMILCLSSVLAAVGIRILILFVPDLTHAFLNGPS